MNHKIFKMKKIIFTGIIILGLFSCKKQDRLYEEYLVPNGIIYPEKARNVIAKPGRERIEISWQKGFDPKVVKARIFWNNYTDFVDVEINPNMEVISRIIERIPENTYSFMVRTYDADDNVSVPVEVIGSVYGKMYENTLVNRRLKSRTNDGQIITFEWFGAVNDTETGISLSYTDINGENQTIDVDRDQTVTFISDFDLNEPMFYFTRYKPDATAIDEFYADTVTISDPNCFIPRHTWTGSCSSFNQEDQRPEAAIDGDPNTVWFSRATNPYPHWLAYNMQKVVKVKYIRLTMRDANPNITFKDFRIEGSMNGVDWTTYPPPNSQYYYFAPLPGISQTFTLEDAPEMQHVRIYCINSHSLDYAVLGEFEVLGTYPD